MLQSLLPQTMKEIGYIMTNDMMQYFITIKKINKAVEKAETLNEALNSGIKELLSAFPSDYCIVWYADDKKENLRPYHFIGNRDFTNCLHSISKGILGKTYISQKSERIFNYKKGQDIETESDFEGINIASMLCIPFSSQEENIGVLQFVRTDEAPPYNDDTADVYELLAGFIALGIADNDTLTAAWRFNEVLLQAKDITRSFKNGDIITNVLKGMNIDVYKGEFLAIVGESGCGKSTFLNIIGGMDKADGGMLTFQDMRVSDFSQNELTLYRRENIGFVFQSYNLISTLTASQNIDLIGELVKDHLDSAEVLGRVGLLDKKDNYPSQLSGGQQQRVSIARALVKKPKLILADEPTAALDYDTSIEVLEIFSELVKNGTTLIMVTHNEEITKMADRVVRMRNGKTYDVQLNRHPLPASKLVW